MARFLLKKFAENSNRTGQFGSFQAQGGQIGDGTITSDPTTIQNLEAWKNGWNDATNNALKLPRIEEMEGVQRVICEMLYNQWIEGISYWQPNMPVIANQTIVQFQTGVMKPKLYLNITGENGEDDPEIDTLNWFEICDTNKIANTDLSNLTQAGENRFNGIMPTGAILPYGGSTAPNGFLLCDGSVISRTTYANLFSVIGTAYGAGDGYTTFNLPNCEDKTIWQDVGFPVGNTTLGVIPNITGSFGANAPTQEGCFVGIAGQGYNLNVGSGRTYFDASRSSNLYITGADRVVPCSINIRFIVKY